MKKKQEHQDKGKEIEPRRLQGSEQDKKTISYDDADHHHTCHDAEEGIIVAFRIIEERRRKKKEQAHRHKDDDPVEIVHPINKSAELSETIHR